MTAITTSIYRSRFNYDGNFLYVCSITPRKEPKDATQDVGGP
jgi:hypothetical protein